VTKPHPEKLRQCSRKQSFPLPPSKRLTVWLRSNSYSGPFHSLQKGFQMPPTPPYTFI